MLRRLAVAIAAAAAYGFSCGTVHGFRLATVNLIKFPLLILVTAATCSLGWSVFSVFLSRELDLVRVQRLSLDTFHDLSVLLAALSPVIVFLGLTVEKPRSTVELGEYPFFLGLNVVAIALCGTLALIRQAAGLLRRYGLSRMRGTAITLLWLAVSLVAGGQCAWFFRPYYGLSFMEDLPFMEGTAPDYRGARSFFEAVYHLVAPP